jgi:hypothetical protein
MNDDSDDDVTPVIPSNVTPISRQAHKRMCNAMQARIAQAGRANLSDANARLSRELETYKVLLANANAVIHGLLVRGGPATFDRSELEKLSRAGASPVRYDITDTRVTVSLRYGDD